MQGDPRPSHYIYEIEFDDGKTACHTFSAADLRRGDHIVPTLVREQRQQDALPYKAIKYYRFKHPY